MKIDLCRICLKNVGEFPLFRNCGDEDVAGIIMSLFNIDVIPNLNSPDTICTICMENIKIANETKESIIKAEILVKTYLEKLETIPEEAGNSEHINEYKVEQFEDSFQHYDDICTKSTQDNGTDQSRNLENDMKSVLPRLPVLYKCDDDQCDYITSTYTQILFHMRSHQNINLYECERCGNEYKSKSRYTYHAAVHSTNRRFTCKICDKGFKSLVSLDQHRLTHKTERIHKCPHCEKTFCHTKGLNSHLLIHNEKTIVCNICDKKFKHSTFLKIHQARTHNITHTTSRGRWKHIFSEKLPCEFCGKTFLKTNLQKHIDAKHFEAKRTLNAHMNLHINPKADPKAKQSKYKCVECDRIFSDTHQLKRHEVLHSGKKQFVCEHCKKEFAFKMYLERHIRLIHDRTNPKNFICAICNKVYLDRCGLTAHMKAHSGENPFHCKLCDSKFRYGKSLRIHMNKKHNSKVVVKKYFNPKTIKDEK